MILETFYESDDMCRFLCKFRMFRCVWDLCDPLWRIPHYNPKFKAKTIQGEQSLKVGVKRLKCKWTLFQGFWSNHPNVCYGKISLAWGIDAEIDSKMKMIYVCKQIEHTSYNMDISERSSSSTHQSHYGFPSFDTSHESHHETGSVFLW